MNGPPPNLLGRAAFAWQADYGQFYLIDGEDAAFVPPEDVTNLEMCGLSSRAAGLVVYTEGCLQQHLRIDIYDREPVVADYDAMSRMPWTKSEHAEVFFPSLSFHLSSPSWPDPLPCGPVFFVPAAVMSARVTWKEFQGNRDDTVPVEPDVIEVTMWPSRSS